MKDKELNDMVMPLFDFGGPIKALSDAAWKRRTTDLSNACKETKIAIVALIQRTERTKIDHLQDALYEIAHGRLDCGRPLGGETARQLARTTLTGLGCNWAGAKGKDHG